MMVVIFFFLNRALRIEVFSFYRSWSRRDCVFVYLSRWPKQHLSRLPKQICFSHPDVQLLFTQGHHRLSPKRGGTCYTAWRGYVSLLPISVNSTQPSRTLHSYRDEEPLLPSGTWELISPLLCYCMFHVRDGDAIDQNTRTWRLHERFTPRRNSRRPLSECR